jgi:hypothetical protein
LAHLWLDGFCLLSGWFYEKCVLTIPGYRLACTSYAQTGPGGVGNHDGSSSQPHNVLWLKSGTGVSTTGALIDSRTDQSGNANSALGSGATRPSLVSSDPNF